MLEEACAQSWPVEKDRNRAQVNVHHDSSLSLGVHKAVLFCLRVLGDAGKWLIGGRGFLTRGLSWQSGSSDTYVHAWESEMLQCHQCTRDMFGNNGWRKTNPRSVVQKSRPGKRLLARGLATASNCHVLSVSPGRLDSQAATKASDGALGPNALVIDEREGEVAAQTSWSPGKANLVAILEADVTRKRTISVKPHDQGAVAKRDFPALRINSREQLAEVERNFTVLRTDHGKLVGFRSVTPAPCLRKLVRKVGLLRKIGTEPKSTYIMTGAIADLHAADGGLICSGSNAQSGALTDLDGRSILRALVA
nr:hypothetical protein Iba_chr05aCG2420 [Ipomoea batatas]